MDAPVFGLQDGDADGDVVFLMCRLEIMDTSGVWVVAINTREKALEGLAFSKGRTNFFCPTTYRPYALSKHMNMAALNQSGTFSTFWYHTIACINIIFFL